MGFGRRRTVRRLPGRRGFTLLELLIALGLVGLIGSWLVRFVGSQRRAFARQGEMVAATRDARAAIDVFLADARNAGFDPRGLAGAAVTRATPDTFAWTADLNADGDVLDTGVLGDERVMYYHDRGRRRWMRRAGGVESPMSESIDTLVFRYLDGFGRPTTSTDRIAGVELLLRFTALDGDVAATIPATTRLPNLAR